MTTPPGASPDPFRPADRGNEPPAGPSGSSPSEPARSPWDQPQGQQSAYQPGQQYPGAQYPGQPGAGQHAGGQYPSQQYPGQQYPAQQYAGGPGQPAPWGQPQGYPQQGQYDQPRKSNGLGIAALVLGILSLLGAFFAGVPGIVLGLIAIVLGVLGLRRVKAGRADNRGIAIAGLVTGILGLLLGILVLVFTVFLVRTTGDCIAELQQTGDQAAYQQCVEESVGQ